MRGASRGDPEVEQPGRGGAGDAAPINPIGGRRGATRSGERGARGRASQARLREAPHSRPPARRPAAPCQGLHAAGTKARREPRRIGGPLGGSVSARKRGQGRQNRRTWSAGGRSRRSQGARRQSGGRLKGSATRRSTPSL